MGFHSIDCASSSGLAIKSLSGYDMCIIEDKFGESQVSYHHVLEIGETHRVFRVCGC